MIQVGLFGIISRWVFRAGITVVGEENLRCDKPFILVANHMSYADGALLLYLYYRIGWYKRIRTTGAGDNFFKRPDLWPYTWLCRMVFISRKTGLKNLQTLAACHKALNTGQNLILFPAGRRAANAPFKLGLGALVTEQLEQQGREIWIVPAYIEGTDMLLPRGGFLPRPHSCRVTVGKPTLFSGDRVEITQQAEVAVAKLRSQRIKAKI